jgi:autotransporter-associated beta strand protein
VKIRAIVSAVAILWTLAAGIHLEAAPYTWSGGSGAGGDAWRNGNNWNPSRGPGGPGTGDVAIFASAGTATNIGINFNDGRGLVAPIGTIVLSAGGNRTVFNSSGNAAGTLRIESLNGQLLLNQASNATLALSNGATQAMNVHFASGGSIHVAASNSAIAIGSAISGSHGFVKTGSGLLRLNGVNSLGGPVTVAGGELALAASAGASLGSVTKVRVQSGASLRLVTAEQLGLATDLDLAGGTLRGASGNVAVEETAGRLTLSANSVVDLRASAITFANSSSVTWGNSAILNITNWRNVGDPLGGRIYFGVGGLTSTQLAQVYFADLGIQGAQLVGPEGELMPIPEAPVAAAAGALVGFIVWRERRRLLRAVQQRLAPRVGVSARPADRHHSADG